MVTASYEVPPSGNFFHIGSGPPHFGPTQTVAKYVPYRWSIKYLFVLRGAYKMDYVLFKTLPIVAEMVSIFAMTV